MKINFLHIILVLVALQSTVAVADLHEAHQSGQEHLQFNHIDQNIDVDSQIGSNDVTNISYDCHHCCHCHGVACYYLDNQIDNQFSIADVSIQFTQFTLFNTRSITPDLRPPIV